MTFDDKVNYIVNFMKENIDVIINISGEEPRYISFESRCFKEDFNIREDKLKIYIINSKSNEMKLVYKNFILIFKTPSIEYGMTRLNFNQLKEKLYYLKEYDEIIGTISYPSLKFNKDNNWKKSLPAGLSPFGICYDNYEPSQKEVLLFLESRVIDLVKERLEVEERNKLYDIYFQGKSITKFIQSKGMRLDKLLDYMLGMNYKDHLWILSEEKLHMDYENYHIKANPRRYISTNIVLDLERNNKNE